LKIRQYYHVDKHLTVLLTNNVKQLTGTQLPVLKSVTGFQNEQLVIKELQTPQCTFVYWQFWYFDIRVIY